MEPVYKSWTTSLQSFYCCTENARAMKLIVILPLVYLIAAHRVELPPKLSANRLQMMEQEILNHLSELVLALKPNDVPKDVSELSPLQLTGCITTVQRGLIRTCISKSPCILKPENAQMMDCSKVETLIAKEHEDDSPDVIRDATHSIFPVVMECVVGTLSPPGMVGFTNVTYVKQGIIDTTSLSDAQRTSALPVLESCLTSTFTLPKVSGNNSAIATKAMICAAKAILLNGCPAVVQTKMAEQQIPVVAEIAATNDSNPAQSGKV